MSMRLDANGDIVKRTASLPSASAFTACGWFRLNTLPGAGQFGNIVNLRNAELGGQPQVSMYYYDTGSAHAFSQAESASILTLSSGSGGWYFFALKSDGSTVTGYLAAEASAQLSLQTAAQATVTPGVLSFGDRFESGGETVNGAFASIKVWDAVLSQAEIEQERRTVSPRRFANLHLWIPCFPGAGERVRDYSGGAKDLTEAGTIVDEDPPPVSWGTGPGFTPFEFPVTQTTLMGQVAL